MSELALGTFGWAMLPALSLLAAPVVGVGVGVGPASMPLSMIGVLAVAAVERSRA